MALLFAYLLTFATLVGSLYVLWIVSGRQLILSSPTIFVVIFVVYHLPLALTTVGTGLGFLLLVITALAAFTFGMAFASDGRSLVAETRLALARTLNLECPLSALRTVLFLMILLAIGVAALYYQGLPPIFDAIEPVLAGDFRTGMILLSQERETLTKAHYFGGQYRGQGLLEVVNKGFWTYLLVLSALMATVARRFSYKLTVLLTAILGYMCMAGSSERAHFAWAMVAVLVAFSYRRRIAIAEWLKWSVWIFAVLVLLTLVTFKYSIQGNVIANVVQKVGTRILFGNGFCTLHIYELIQDGTLRFQYGLEHFRVFMNTLPAVQFSKPLSHEIFLLMAPPQLANATTYWSHTYLGLTYIDFGVPGTILIFLLLGWALQKLHLFILNSGRSLLQMTFLAVIALQAGRIVVTSIINIFPIFIVLSTIHGIVVLTANVIGRAKRPLTPTH